MKIDLTVFDWISPLLTLIQDWRNRPSTGFALQLQHVSTMELERFLKSKGVKAWGWMLVDDVTVFRVRKRQGRYVEMWLAALGEL